ncbi:TPA: permease [Streptococcus equi subsp. zooepidemicus]|nr:permease [Streptococcus equi subsp. zooepidemicus]
MRLVKEKCLQQLLLYVVLVIIIALFSVSLSLASALIHYSNHFTKEFQDYASNEQRYTMVDNFIDASRFEDVRGQVEVINRLGDFYNQLNQDKSLKALSVFNQPIFLKHFKGDSSFYENSQAFLEANPEASAGIKSIQLNKMVFDYYHLKVASGDELHWSTVDYQPSQEIPILLGAAYQPYYHIGDIIEADYYFRQVRFSVKGFLAPDSFIYYRNNPEFYLDSYMIIPYPYRLEPIDPKDFDFESILYFAMVNMDIVTPLKHKAFIEHIKQASDKSRFIDFSIVAIDDFFLRYSGLIAIFEQNSFLLIVLLLLLFVLVHAVAFGICVLLQRLNLPYDRVFYSLGDLRYLRRHGRLMACLYFEMVSVFGLTQYLIYHQWFMLQLLLFSSLEMVAMYCLARLVAYRLKRQVECIDITA